MNEDDKKKFAKTFDLMPVGDGYKAPVTYTEPNQDYDYARQNQHAALEVALKSLPELAEIAAQSQHPRAYEVLTALLKTISDMNKDILELQRQKQEIEKGHEIEPEHGPIRNQTNIILTTSDLNKMIEEMSRKKKNEEGPTTS